MQQKPRVLGTHAFFFREGDAVSSSIGTASRARTTNVATIVTPTSHGLWTGALITASGVGGAGYNLGPIAVTVINATSFSYASTGGNEATTPDVGGTILLAGTASKSFRPGPNDASWIDLGVIEDSSEGREQNDIELYGPNPGKIVLTDVIANKHKSMVKLTCQEWGPFHVEMFHLAGELNTASTQFNPGEGIDKKGWLKVQRYDQDDALVEVIDRWVRLKPSGDVNAGGGDVMKPQYEALVLQSILNTGTLS